MSSTNRNKASQRNIADYYRTPIDAISLFLKEFRNKVPLNDDIKILDPCSGGDNEHPMAYPTALTKIGFEIIDTIDIREDSRAKVKGDYLQIDCKDKYDMIITNPPFNIALDIIKKSNRRC